ncbi:hypothetical protein [Mucilaginibacter lappiensis]|uniref:Uncharacterized protein n=1 Tax=Mucilaginibacter lappiensis TaxID=354630 RepID=A0A841JFW2_9SPHI|nr:hypothetical protein [Mucilaginibacter lappiensis]MBB6129182.1 hypothetical protein [Mucilaginibacter lappiensis]
MKQLDVFKKIGGILKELNDQYNYLEAESSELNELELELFVANAHFLKDHAEILRRLHERANPSAPAPIAEKPEPLIEISKPIPLPLPPPAPIDKKPEPIHEQRYFEPVVQQKPAAESKLELTQAVVPPVQPTYNPVQKEPEPLKEEEPVPHIDLKSENTSDTYSFERHEPEPVKEELELDQAAEWEDEEDHFEQEELTEQLLPVTTDAQPIPELPLNHVAKQVIDHTDDSKAVTDDKVLTINQKISALKAEKDKGAAATPPATVSPITDLKSAINLNDKLLYIKDLFNGYSLAYSEAVEIVNRFNSFDEAERFLKTNYVVKNNWESKPATTEKFYALLKRRYPAG